MLLLLVLGQFANILVAVAVPIAFSILGLFFVNLSNKGSMVQVSEVQFPHLHRMSAEVGYALDMPLPAMFVKQSPVINAYATGLFGQRTVVLHSALLEQLTHDEVKAVIAHEFGHIKCNHIVYGILQNIAVSGFLGNALFAPIKWLFYYSSRAAEYSADQAALVGTMNLQACVTSEIKLSVGASLYEQMNIQAYMMQIEEFSNTTGSKFIEILNNQTHPMTVNRILHVIRYYRSSKYQQLAASHGRAGTTTLTAGNVGTRDLFHRVAAKAEYERDVQRAGQNVGQQQPVSPSYPQPQPQYQPQAQPGVAPAVAPPSITCGACGVPLDAHARFCVRCGTPVAGTGPATPTPVAPVQEEAPAARVVRRVVRSGAEPAVVPEPQAPPAPPVQQAPAVPVAPAACGGCGQPAEAGARFCPHCGRPTA